MNVSSSFSSSEDGEQPSRRRKIWTAIVATTRSIIHAPSSRRWTRRFSRHYPKRPAKVPSTSVSADDKSKVTSNTSSSPASPPTVPQRPSYRVATASQLNGRHVERLIRSGAAGGGEKQLPPHPERTQSLRDREAPPVSPPTPPLLRSQSTPLLWSTPPRSPPADSPETPSSSSPSYSPNLSTIAEHTEPDTLPPQAARPLSSILSIGTARIGYILPPTLLDYETSISRFGAKAIHLLTTLGPALEIYGRREMAFQRSPEFATSKARHSYFHPALSKLFTRTCICDINLQGDPIHLSSSSFELGSAGLEIGACAYLNLSTADGYAGNRRAILRTEYDTLAKQARYVVHFASPLVDEGLGTRYTLVAQVDVTNALRRLALQEVGDPGAGRDEDGERTAVSSQMRRFLSFIYWLGAFHSNALCFTRSPAPSSSSPSKGTLHGVEHVEGLEWQLRFASAHIYQDPGMVVTTGPGSANDDAEMHHMALMMDGREAFVQSVAWGRSASFPNHDASTSAPSSRSKDVTGGGEQVSGEGKQTIYLQYCVPVTDGRSEGLAEKWWVVWLVEKRVPGFWGRSSGWTRCGDEVVEYPFLV